MRFQDHASNCGPASLSNALQAMGIVRSQEECAVLCKTKPEGTSPKQLLKALKALGRVPAVLSEKRAAVALLFLSFWLCEGRAVLLIVDDDTHWVAAIGKLGNRFLVADPADNELVVSLSLEELAERWLGTTHYGVVL